MSKRITTEEFIERAKKVYGDKYDYSKVVYVNNHTKVCVICPIHGELWVTPVDFMKHGCSYCSHNNNLLQRRQVAIQKIQKELLDTGYKLVEPLKYVGDRGTMVKLHCDIHNYTWEISYHQLVYNYKRSNSKYCGCKLCLLTYTKESCLLAAKTCKRRSEFAKEHKGEYFAALRNGWLDDICGHMEIVGNHYKRCIYAYEFEDINGYKYVYVGLTDDIKTRDLLHSRRGSVYQFCKQNQIPKPEPKQLTEYIDKEEAKELEGKTLITYIENGWLPINKVKTGGLGGHKKNEGFTFEQCLAVGKKYQKRSDWKNNDYPTYYIASKFKWIDIILPANERHCSNGKFFWTKEKVTAEAAKYNRLKDFMEAEPRAYQLVLKNGWIDEICAHMKRLRKETEYTIEIIQEEIQKHETLNDFMLSCTSMYDWLRRHKIKLTDISNKKYRPKKVFQKPVGQYDLEGKLIRKYDNARQAVLYGFDYKHISAVCRGKEKTHKGYVFKFLNKETDVKVWNYDNCKEEAAKYGSKRAFQIDNPYVYRKSSINGWLDDFFPPEDI